MVMRQVRHGIIADHHIGIVLFQRMHQCLLIGRVKDAGRWPGFVQLPRYQDKVVFAVVNNQYARALRSRIHGAFVVVHAVALYGILHTSANAVQCCKP